MIVTTALTASPELALAVDGLGTDSQGATLTAHSHHKKNGGGGKKSQSTDRVSGPSDKQRLAAINRQAERYVDYVNRKHSYDACVVAGTAGCTGPGDPVELPDPLTRGQIAAVPQISPQQAAIVAVAQLHLDPPKPVIGPSPDINEWHMAAVGYPYWLWAEGNLNPVPVSTTVADLTVSLDAHLASTTFDLGDGTRLTCTDLTARWSPAVEPAAQSPSCGHTYKKPSLPKGNYKITAYSTWAVDWSVNGVGGTIPLYQQASTTVPVGELQVLTH